MALKRGLRPLAGSELLDEDSLAKLRTTSITTVEELVSAIGSDPGSVAHLLDLSSEEVDKLRERALGLLSPEMRKSLEEPMPEFKLGAFPPPAPGKR
jgi:hypothetical protein